MRYQVNSRLTGRSVPFDTLHEALAYVCIFWPDSRTRKVSEEYQGVWTTPAMADRGDPVDIVASIRSVPCSTQEK